MNQGELVRFLARKLNLTQAETVEAVKAVIEKMTDELTKGDRVYIRGFGSLRKEKRKAKRTRDITTGKMTTIPERETIEFTPSRTLLKKINR